MMRKYLASALLFLVPVVPLNVQPVFAAGDTTALSAEDQNKEAFKEFEKILDLTGETDRAAILPQLETGYLDIIKHYPLSHLAQESCWRLMTLYLADFNPPAYAKAEGVRAEFIRKYPDSKMRGLIDRTLAESYHKNEQWEKLLVFYTPSVRQSVETGKFPRALDIFMYAEAKFGLNDIVEAEKGYKIVVANFPKSREGLFAAKRLEEIQTLKSKKP
ncbi:MAG: hypothetical protein FIA94_09270 [Nitrospirae bacterium]|nr:hypothetical protein [Nitrospirota bacterium]